MKQDLSKLDLSILKYYKKGFELSGFEGVHGNLVKMMYLDGDLELTFYGHKFIKEFKKWDKIEAYDNKMVIYIKPKLT